MHNSNMRQSKRRITKLPASEKFPQLTLQPRELEDIEFIGQGSFGQVYKAYDVALQKTIALKRVPKFSNEISREFTILYHLRNSNHSLKMYDYYLTQNKKGTIFQNYIMQYFEWDLDSILSQQLKSGEKLSLQLHCYIMREILRCLKEIHQFGVIHRDIKPDNILVSQDLSTVKISDLGSAKPFKNRNSSFPSRFCTSYRPPQLYLGVDFQNYSIDMWATGCLFFEMIANVSPPLSNRNDKDNLLQAFEGIAMTFGGVDKKCQNQIMRKVGMDRLRRQIWKYFNENQVREDRVNMRWFLLRSARLVKYVPDDIVQLIDSLLQINPSKRITSQKALEMVEKILEKFASGQLKEEEEFQSIDENDESDQEDNDDGQYDADDDDDDDDNDDDVAYDSEDVDNEDSDSADKDRPNNQQHRYIVKPKPVQK